MESLLFHPKVVHLPVALAVLMPWIAAGIALCWKRDWLPHRTWWIAVVLQAILVGSAFLAMRTGEAEEDRVEKVVAERHIEHHEEAAELFAWTSVWVLIVFVIAGVLPWREYALRAATLATAGALVALALGYRAAAAGGALVYKYGAAGAYATPETVIRHQD